MGASLHVVPLAEIVTECVHTKTYRFRADFAAKPGQFVMLWVPRRDEVPMALSYLGDVKGVTIHACGDTTEALAKEAKVGDLVGVRGPYGNGFAIEGRRALAAVGGTGISSVIAAIEAYAAAGKQVETVLGARTAAELIFADRARKAGPLHVSTDDGTQGFRGFASDLAKQVLARGGFDMVLTCGPEPMMKLVVDAANALRIPVQASLERYMKCGIGLCDACAFDDRLVCRDGPVFRGDALAESRDFGAWRRDASGRRVKA